MNKFYSAFIKIRNFGIIFNDFLTILRSMCLYKMDSVVRRVCKTSIIRINSNWLITVASTLLKFRLYFRNRTYWISTNKKSRWKFLFDKTINFDLNNHEELTQTWSELYELEYENSGFIFCSIFAGDVRTASVGDTWYCPLAPWCGRPRDGGRPLIFEAL